MMMNVKVGDRDVSCCSQLGRICFRDSIWWTGWVLSVQIWALRTPHPTPQPIPNPCLKITNKLSRYWESCWPRKWLLRNTVWGGGCWWWWWGYCWRRKSVTFERVLGVRSVWSLKVCEGPKGCGESPNECANEEGICGRCVEGLWIEWLFWEHVTKSDF